MKKGQLHSCGPDVGFVGRSCQLLLTSACDAQWSAVRAGSGADILPVNNTLHLSPSASASPQQVRTSPRSPCPSPPSWWATSTTLWCCLRSGCRTGRSCCWILSAPSGTSVTWWFVPTARLCSAMPRASSEISRLSMRWVLQMREGLSLSLWCIFTVPAEYRLNNYIKIHFLWKTWSYWILGWLIEWKKMEI